MCHTKPKRTIAKGVQVQVKFTPYVTYKHQDAAFHLITRWLALLGFAVVFLGLTAWIQKRKDPI